MNRPNLDKLIEQMAQQVRAPKGAQADHDKVYARLRERMQPVEMPVIGRRRPTLLNFIRSHRAAAAVVIGVWFMAAFAGLYLTQPEWFGVQPQSVEETVVAPAEVSVFTFDHAPLRDIAAQLSAKFDTNITVATDRLAEYQVTATFSSDESLQDIISALAIVAKCQWREVEGGYVLE